MAATGQQAPPGAGHGLLRSSLRSRTPKGVGASAHSARWARTGIKTRDGSSQPPLRPAMPKHAHVLIPATHTLPSSRGN